ncbi:MAG: hypothetical protein LBG17_07395 [Bacteroidales bacterium]|jgi:hypothetical protein|nr:hypothetical protein [Bacteroidales bacterium]
MSVIKRLKKSGSILAKKACFLAGVCLLAMFSITSANAQQQSKTITGTVVDKSGEPMIGAAVVVKGTTVAVATDMPAGEVDFSKHQQHSVHVKAGKLTGKSKPPKVHGYEVWNKVGGDPPASDSEWTYVNFASRTPLVINYPQTEVGKSVYYRFRWVNTRNQPGPWSEGFVSAVIA